MEEGTPLRSTIERIVRAQVIQENADGTYKIREVDREVGGYVYDTPFDEIDSTFYISENDVEN